MVSHRSPDASVGSRTIVDTVPGPLILKSIDPFQ
jgi:hypothetical protein